jgi:flagellar L-ring protein precursor FlgH
MKNIIKNTILGLAISTSLAACGAGDRIANIGKEPQMSQIENPQLRQDYRPVSMPMPAPASAEKQPNSLWSSDRTAFFKDQRATNVGDILTVLIEIDDQAELENETERSRSSGESAEMPALLGVESHLAQVLPEAVNPANLASLGSNSNYNGQGTVEREEEIDFRLAAIITQVLPNGNLVIHGKQEARVNYEKRIVQIDGVIRPEDISINNTINHDQIAEARIAYGGEGQITDMQQPRYGQQLYDIIFPF